MCACGERDERKRKREREGEGGGGRGGDKMNTLLIMDKLTSRAKYQENAYTPIATAKNKSKMAGLTLKM